MVSPENKVHEKDANCIDEDITRCSFPKRDKCLMVFIGDGVEHSDDCRNNECLSGNHKSLKSAKEEKVKNCIFSDVSPFFNKNIERAKV